MKKKRKVSKKSKQFWKEIKEEIELMHRLRSTPFSYHRYKKIDKKGK